MMRVSKLHFLVALRTHINMSKALQVAFCCMLVAVVVQARPGYLGYPYGAAVHPYGAVPYAAAAHPVPVHDTPEVAAAKAAHFAAYNAAAAAAAAAPDNGAYAGAYATPHGHYVGPLAGVPVLVNGVPADTPEVAAAKAAHLAAHAHIAHGGHGGHYYG